MFVVHSTDMKMRDMLCKCVDFVSPVLQIMDQLR